MYHEKNTMFADSALTNEGWSSPIFTPDMMTPSQFVDTLRSRQLDPDRALLLAVLEDGIRDYQRAVAREHEVRGGAAMARDRNAKAWIEGADAPITFADCCDAFGLDPEWVRKGLLAMKPTQKLRRQHIVKGSVAA